MARYHYAFANGFEYDQVFDHVHETSLTNYPDLKFEFIESKKIILINAHSRQQMVKFDNMLYSNEYVFTRQMLDTRKLDESSKRWYSVELEPGDSRLFKLALNDFGIQYEASECFNLIHFEVYCDRNTVDELNTWIDNNL